MKLEQDLTGQNDQQMVVLTFWYLYMLFCFPYSSYSHVREKKEVTYELTE